MERTATGGGATFPDEAHSFLGVAALLISEIEFRFDASVSEITALTDTW
jgi:hypothetical protein